MGETEQDTSTTQIDLFRRSRDPPNINNARGSIWDLHNGHRATLQKHKFTSPYILAQFLMHVVVLRIALSTGAVARITFLGFMPDSRAWSFVD